MEYEVNYGLAHKLFAVSYNLDKIRYELNHAPQFSILYCGAPETSLLAIPRNTVQYHAFEFGFLKRFARL